MKKLLVYYNFIIVTTFVLLALFNARTGPELTAGALFSPLFIYFLLLVLPRQTHPAMAKNVLPVNQKASKGEPPQPSKFTLDIDRRLFLKLIGATGASFFLFSLFSNKAEVPFLSRLTGASDTTTGSDPTASYRISEVDEGITTFYGFTKNGGAWFIMQEDTNTGSFRYIKGNSKFPDAWANRKKLQYDYYHNIF